MARSSADLRPFWLHQAAEYLLGMVLVAQGLQSLTPVVPSVAGGIMLLNAACVEGPLGAFRLVPRRLHRWFDLVVIGVVVALAALPFVHVDNTSRLVMLVVAGIFAFVWWNTRFEKVVRAPGQPVDRGEAVGRFAGRVAGSAVRAVRDRRQG